MRAGAALVLAAAVAGCAGGPLERAPRCEGGGRATVLAVDADNRLRLNREPIVLAELTDALAAAAGPEGCLIIRADGETVYADVLRAMSVASGVFGDRIRLETD